MFRKFRQQRKQKLLKADAVRRRSSSLSVLYQGYALNQTTRGVAPNDHHPLVVSLTTFNKRIDDVYLTIESLFQQSRKADKVVLWLSREEFGEADIPEILNRQRERGLDIEFCDQDLGPYKKFYYSLKKYPDSLILTVDDDILYPIDTIDLLYRAHRKQPDVIHCHRAHQILLDASGKALPYKQWRSLGSKASLATFPTGAGGVLYFPGCFDPEIFNRQAFQQLAPNADDVWLKAMSLKQGTLCKKVEDSREWGARFVPIEGSQTFSLKRANKQPNSGNDAKIRAVFDTYDLWPLLR